MNGDFTQVTNDLKNIIKQAERSGKAAWQAGKLLKAIKENESYRIKYRTFRDYVEKEFGRSEQIANTYIMIYEKFKEDEIGNLIYSCLKEIAEIEDTRVRKDVVKAFKDESPENFKVKEVIATVALLKQNDQEVTTNQVQNVVRETIEKSKREEEELKKKKKDLTKYGEPLKSDYILAISELMEKEPINEMGVIALFCVIFHYMRKPFKIGNQILEFKSIKYVQTGFPDACITCKVIDRRLTTNTELKVEFEYQSFNYMIRFFCR